MRPRNSVTPRTCSRRGAARSPSPRAAAAPPRPARPGPARRGPRSTRQTPASGGRAGWEGWGCGVGGGSLGDACEGVKVVRGGRAAGSLPQTTHQSGCAVAIAQVRGPPMQHMHPSTQCDSPSRPAQPPVLACSSPSCSSQIESAGSPGMQSSWPGATLSGTIMPASAYRCLSSSSLQYKCEGRKGRHVPLLAIRLFLGCMHVRVGRLAWGL